MNENVNVEKTEGLDLIWKLQADPANVVVSSTAAELRGFAYYDAPYRWPAVRGVCGSITVTVPRAGLFYPAVVVYDTAKETQRRNSRFTPGRGFFEILFNSEKVGSFAVAENDDHQHIFFLKKPIEFKAGDRLTFNVADTGTSWNIVEDIFLLAAKPPVRRRRLEITEVAADYVERDGAGQMRLTWLSSRPAACRIDYGTSAKYGKVVVEDQPLQVHRVYLSGLRAGAKYRARINAWDAGGKIAAAKSILFTFKAPAIPAGKARHESLRLKVENPYDFALTAFPVTSGVPFAAGELGSAANLRLLDDRLKAIPVQARVTMRWKDGSIKWLLVSFLASAAARKTSVYTLEYGRNVKRAPMPTALKYGRKGGLLTVKTGPLTIRFDAAKSGFPAAIDFDCAQSGRAARSNENQIAALIQDLQGEFYTTNHPAESIAVEEAGPVRLVVKTTGQHRSQAGQPLFAYTNRFVFYAGLPFIRLYYTWGNDREESLFTEIKSLRLKIPHPAGDTPTWTVGLGGGVEAHGHGPMALSQMRDNACELIAATGDRKQAKRAEGWIDVSNANWGITATVRDFWQLYPKALRLAPEGLQLDLCPEFAAGTYDDCTKLDEIKRFYYLMGGRYKFKQGVQKQHEIMLRFHPGEADLSAARQTARAFQEPLIAVCPPERYCNTRVFGEILPATPDRFPEYERACERVYRNYIAHRDEGHEFGMLNYGDLWGERKVNWANGEYDHHHALLMQFIRTGDRRWYFPGEAAARHAIDVDTCHYGPKRGCEWGHSMGHTGDYFKTQFEGAGGPGSYTCVTHTWAEGFYDWHALSGDPTAPENAALVVDFYDGEYLNDYDYIDARANGWHLVLTMAAYHATYDPFYLNAARLIVERTLERQTPGGGWHRQLHPEHCSCRPRHRGEANFMLGVLAGGLREYLRAVPDRRLTAAVIGGARQLIGEMWEEHVKGFRYTSCPKTQGGPSNAMVEGMLFLAYRLGGDKDIAATAMRAMSAAFESGITHIVQLRWMPHLIYDMDLVLRDGIAGAPTPPATIIPTKFDTTRIL